MVETRMLKQISQKKSMAIRGLIFSCLILLSGCSSNVLVKEKSLEPFKTGKILIIPFKDISSVYGENENVRCPVCGHVFITGEVAENASRILTDQLFILLQNQENTRLIPTGQAQGVLSGLLAESNNEVSERNLWIETGRALGADAVIGGYIYRFRERIGTKYSAKVSASVAFDIHLIRVADGRLLWSGSFDETQRSLSEDLFKLGSFLHRKGKWITAREMAIAALEDMFETLHASKNPESDR